jgi:predicted transposase YbfD/YdcC
MAFRETSISRHFIKISDPREEVKTQHSLLNILTIVLCAVIGGSEDFYDIEEFAKCLDSVRYLFDWEAKNDFGGVFHTETLSVEKGHGRIETRKVYSIGELDKVEGLGLENWPGLESLTMVASVREINGSSTSERRYYISSLTANAKVIGDSVRSHWGIENSLHWVMDVTFHEDYARNRKEHSAANMAAMRHFALNLIKQEKNTKDRIKGKRKRAGWNDDCLLKLIGLF